MNASNYAYFEASILNIDFGTQRASYYNEQIFKSRHDHFFSSKSLFICLCVCMIQAHGERKTIARRKKLLEKKKLEDQEKARIKAQVMSSMCCTLFALLCLTLTGKRVKQTSELDCDTYYLLHTD